MNKHLTVAAAAVLLSLSLTLSVAARPKATIKVVNKSEFTIHHLFLSSTSDRHWGPDQLGDDVLETDDTMTLTHIDCDDYDIRVVDEDGDECIIEEVELCGDDTVWKITDKDLLRCEGY